MYKSPIELIQSMTHEIQEEQEKMVVRAVNRAGVNIDRDGLIAAINNDRRRYEEAYQQGWNDCKKEAEEPRPLTIQDLEAIYNTRADHVWPYNTPPELWMTVNPKVRRICGFWICWRDIVYSLEGRSPFYVRENYGKVWMIWTREPTDEQQEGVQWDE